MGIIWGLVAALSWGIADFLSRRTSELLGWYRALFWMQAGGVVATTGLLFVTGGWPSLPARAWGLALAVSVLNLVGSVFLCRALAHGILSLVSPISSSFAAVAVGLALLSGERPTAVRLAGLAIALAGVVLAAWPAQGPSPTLVAGGLDPVEVAVGTADLVPAPAGRSPSAGVADAVAAALAYGAAFWLLGGLVPITGSVWPIWAYRVLAVVLLGLASRVRRLPLAPPRGEAIRVLVPVTLFDTLAFYAYGQGVVTEMVAVVAVLASLYSAVAVVLGWARLGERLGRVQIVGIGTILVGVAMVSAPAKSVPAPARAPGRSVTASARDQAPLKDQAPLIVGAAADLTGALHDAASRYQRETGQPVALSFAASAVLARQLAEGAPFDLVLAADSATIRQLARDGEVAPGSVRVFARGTLVIWSRTDAPPLRRLEDLTGPAFRRVAIADPRLAPYGRLAQGALFRAHLGGAIAPKLVVAENVRQALLMARSGNADAALVARSVAVGVPGRLVPVPASEAPPLDQALGIPTRAPHASDAARFVAFLRRPVGRAALAAHGLEPVP